MLAIDKLIAVHGRVKDFKLCQDNPELIAYTQGQIQDNINYLQARDQSDKWQDCIEFNIRLDKTRNQSFFDVTPEFKLHD
jgi:hypothetical protein